MVDTSGVRHGRIMILPICRYCWALTRLLDGWYQICTRFVLGVVSVERLQSGERQDSECKLNKIQAGPHTGTCFADILICLPCALCFDSSGFIILSSLFFCLFLGFLAVPLQHIWSLLSCHDGVV